MQKGREGGLGSEMVSPKTPELIPDPGRCREAKTQVGRRRLGCSLVPGTEGVQ